MRAKSFLLLSFCSLISSLVSAQANQIAIGFYNLENLFDTQNDPQVFDEEFTPEGEKNWTEEKYQDKLGRLAKVLQAMQAELKDIPLALLGVCEIENQKVLEDLVRHPNLKDKYLKIVHRDSRDVRGVDVGLLYRSEFFQVLQVKSYPIHLPPDGERERITRDILLVKGMLKNQLMFITVNHWPSRRGGELLTKPFRFEAARINKHISDSIRQIHPDAGVVVMGDLNDNPDDASLRLSLKAKAGADRLEDFDFYNPFFENYKKGEGTGAFNDSWGLFDQILLSSNLTTNKTTGQWKYKSDRIFRRPFMVERDGHYKNYPKRTFSGNIYNYGYSDHFPVYCILNSK
ncbi:MAG: endonuclease/exonuclease/phosphatase family protein [Saprospiraceae bacterium]|nr:endonuclease/exonuclease/phosphatase family protein [Saprospiraceae bacterium]